MGIRFSITKRSLNRFLASLQHTLLMSFLMSLIWLSGLSLTPALAMPIVVAPPEGITSQIADSATRMSALIPCLPEQLSQPSLKRALNEMGNDQLERAFHLKANPKLSPAETELASCLNRQGFTS